MIISCVLISYTLIAACENRQEHHTASSASGTDITTQQPATDPVAANSSKEDGAPATDTIWQDFTGVWIDDQSKTQKEGAGFEGAITICPNGHASYAVFSNQLYFSLRAKQVKTGPQKAHIELYFRSADVGRGFANADLKLPDSGTLIATAELTAEFRMSFTWLAKDFVASARRNSPGGGRKVFPKDFYMYTASKSDYCSNVE